MVMLFGPRQAGKSTLFKKMISDLLDSGIPPSRVFYFNCDFFQVRELFKDIISFLGFLRQQENNRLFLFIDEAQRIQEAGLFLKQLADADNLNLKIYVSGSSSLLLRAKTKEHLTGRQLKFNLLPFSWQEFLKFKNISIKADSKYFSLYGTGLNALLAEFLTWGGYPKIVTQKNEEKKKQQLQELATDYLEKDIINFLNLDAASYNRFLRIIANQTANVLNYQELSRTVGVSLPTIAKYLKIFEETFVGQTSLPFFSNKRKELSHNPKLYLYDAGFHNHLVNNFSEISLRADLGALVENFVWTELIKNGLKTEDIHFWRTSSGAEVDFVFEQGKELIPLEVKFQEMKREEVSVSFTNFIKHYHPKIGIILTRNFFGERKIEVTKVIYMPVVALNPDDIFSPNH
jgi:uncharacterized protein